MKTLLIALAFLPSLCANTNYFRHVVFDNSHTDRNYYYSQASSVAPSALDLSESKAPVEEKRFVSPPNALRLKWKSNVGGDWQFRIKVPERYARKFDFEGDTLSVWCYSEDVLSNVNCPWLYLMDANNVGTPTIRLLGPNERLEARKWTQIKRRFSDFAPPFGNTHDSKFDSNRLAAIVFVQGLDDAKEHTLIIDDIHVQNFAVSPAAPKFDLSKPPDLKMHIREPLPPGTPEPPSNLAVEGYDSHFDLSWTASRSTNLHAYKLYRSFDGKEFTPIAIQRAGVHRFQDFVGSPGKTAHYRISAYNLAGDESQSLEPVSAKTRAFSDDELLTMVQEASFRYYWEGAHPDAGLALEILPGDPNLVALGGSGFGVMTIPIAVERKFITRDEATERMLKIVRFLKTADRFHGVWPHFLDGRTGKTIPFFGKYDDGADLVETAFMMQGLLTVRQYFTNNTNAEREIRETITTLWREAEWNWFRKTPDSDVLYWHWSPNHAWHISHPLIGWNETMIIYLLAIASPTHGVPASLYHTGWAGQSDRHVRYRQNWSRTTAGDHYTNNNSYYGHKLEVGVGSGSDLFFTQFSFFGFDPRDKRDQYANYFENNRKIALINRAYCIDNPRKRIGYGENCWGLTAGIHGSGKPVIRDETGTITCHAAIGSFPYTPKESMAALKHFYRDHGKKIWGNYGFYDGFNETENWFEEVNMALNQAPMVIMIENHRTGLPWRLFMSNPEIAPALQSIGFKKD